MQPRPHRRRLGAIAQVPVHPGIDSGHVTPRDVFRPGGTGGRNLHPPERRLGAPDTSWVPLAGAETRVSPSVPLISLSRALAAPGAERGSGERGALTTPLEPRRGARAPQWAFTVD